jgi:hypothetical protein
MHERDLPQAAIHSRKADQTGAVGLMVLVVVLIFMVCTAASLLLTLPQSFDSTANAAPRVTEVAAGKADVPFHEQYRMDAVGEPVNPPTF